MHFEVTEGTAKVFWISGSDEAVTLLETTGTYSDTITPLKAETISALNVRISREVLN